jgi:hypothetical protein
MKGITFIRNYPIIETVIVLGAGFLYNKAWSHIDSREENVAKRSLGVTVVTGQLNGIITSGSLTLALIGAISAALLGSANANLTVKAHAFWAMIFVFISILFSLLSYGVMTTYFKDHNVALHRQIVILTAISMMLFAMGLWRLILGIWGYVWP